jgi:hypothetical protein
MSARQMLTRPGMITVMLILQFVPMVLFPPQSFDPKSQEWWLPVILAFLALVATVQIFRRSISTWPWLLILFSQGFNIISRLLMLFPHAMYNSGGQQYFNTTYVVLSLVSMAISAFFLWYMELPEVRMGFYRES